MEGHGQIMRQIIMEWLDWRLKVGEKLTRLQQELLYWERECTPDAPAMRVDLCGRIDLLRWVLGE
jgi:hypothetical protein